MKNINNSNIVISKNFKWEDISISVDILKEKIKSMLIWWAIWDAMWVPVEMKTKEYINENYWRVNKYLDSSLNVFFNKWWLATWKKWLVSDDTILTFSWIESILETWKIDFDNLMKISIKNYKNFPYWFWGWTTKAFKKYEELEEENPNNKNYINLWDKESAWNWVIMKQSPYAAYFLTENLNKKEIESNIEILNKITHAHPTAIVASIIHNEFLLELLKTENKIDFKDLLKYLIKYSEKLEKKYLEIDNDKVSDLLKELLKDQNNWWLNNFDEILEKYWWWDKKIYSSWYVLTTIWIVYSIFLNKQDFEWFLDSINIGWDVDTFAAIIWNMIWAYNHNFYEKKYEDWIQYIENIRLQTNNFINKLILDI